MPDNRKALIISVGTGIGGTKETENLARGLLFSIKNHNPDKVYFLVSRESLHKTLPLIQAEDNRPNEVIEVSDPDNIEEMYSLLKGKLPKIKGDFSFVTVDYTSGTKAMTAAVAIVGTLFNVEMLSYVSGQRSGGVVVPGTEHLNVVSPFFDYCERRIKQAVELFNLQRYEAVLQIAAQLKDECPAPQVLTRLAPLETASRAYAYWDKFSHQQAFRELSGVKIAKFDYNKEFLARLNRHLEANKQCDTINPECKNKFLGILNPRLEPKMLKEIQILYLADIIASAQRRAETEGKYDDAVARLYRAIELIGQYELFNYGITDSSQVDIWSHSPNMATRWGIQKGTKVALPLDRCYSLLADKGNTIGKKYTEDRLIRDSLSQRNYSVLAHGLKPLSREEYKIMAEEVRVYAAMAVPSIEDWIQKASFITWPDDTWENS